MSFEASSEFSLRKVRAGWTAPALVFSAFLLTSFAPRAIAADTATLLPEPAQTFVDNQCSSCHDEEEKKGGLDLTSLAFKPSDPANFATWVKIFDRTHSGEMPPKKKARPPADELKTFTGFLSDSLIAAERERLGPGGRSMQRRLNRYEYENALRDLLQAPWLQVKDSLPEDGEAFRFNKVGEALDVSHVQLARYLTAADEALRQVMAKQLTQPPTKVTRYYARDQKSYTRPMAFSKFNQAPERATFPVLGFSGQPEVRRANAPMTVGKENPVERDLEGVGVVAGSYEPIEPRFDNFKAPVSGRYRLHFEGYTVWVGPGKADEPKAGAKPGAAKPPRWWIPDLDDISRGHRTEPITIYSELPPRQLRQLGSFDLTPEPQVHDMEVYLLVNETIRSDAGRLFRSRPGAGRFQNPLAQPDGQPGVVYRWLEVEGPLYDEWPTAGQKLLFGDLSLKKSAAGVPEVASEDPENDAKKLLKNFVEKAYRQPVNDTEATRFLPVITAAMKSGSHFSDAMIAGYTAVLCSPEFLYVDEKPGRLDDYALASRLSFFLWNSSPDNELRALAAKGELHLPKVLQAQTERLLADPKSDRFVNAFLDYWLDLRKIVATAPDSTLYPDYYLDDLLQESALEETQRYFADLVQHNLPASFIVSSDFSWMNERLANHYGLLIPEGVGLRRVKLPPDSVRGGFLTQAAVLKVTSNGTTTSPVIRGAWVMDRILGRPPSPPPPSVPAIDPDTRGAATIRQQLEKHRSDQTCSACHANIDPPGFALENFDVMGGWRAKYRAVEGTPKEGIGKGGQKFQFHDALMVDASGKLSDGRTFDDIRSFKTLLLQDESQIARNLVRQLVVFSTGAPVRFSDRAAVETILQKTESQHYGVRALIHEIVQSPLFLEK